LKGKGYYEDKEHIFIEGLPVQFIPAYNELITEAVTRAKKTYFRRTPTKVVRVEHLMAILLQTNRPKDRARLSQLIDQTKIDRDAFAGILKRHGLEAKWQKFNRQNGESE
jgi:hypothetical protein